jgi:hypothetical protein
MGKRERKPNARQGSALLQLIQAERGRARVRRSAEAIYYGGTGMPTIDPLAAYTATLLEALHALALPEEDKALLSRFFDTQTPSLQGKAYTGINHIGQISSVKDGDKLHDCYLTTQSPALWTRSNIQNLSKIKPD